MSALPSAKRGVIDITQSRLNVLSPTSAARSPQRSFAEESDDEMEDRQIVRPIATSSKEADDVARQLTQELVQHAEAQAAGGDDEAAAAVRIQAIQRGRKDRARVQELKDQNQAATKLQAMQRGRKDRAKVEELRSTAASAITPAAEDADGNEAAAAVRIQAIQRGRKDRARVQELKEQHQAATKLQAIQRGRKDRAEVQKLKEESK